MVKVADVFRRRSRETPAADSAAQSPAQTSAQPSAQGTGRTPGSTQPVPFPEPIGTPDGPRLKVLVRGDCTSRRSMALNPELFARPPIVVADEKSPFVQHLDAAMGSTLPDGYLEQVCDAEAMNPVLRAHYLGQAERSVLTEPDADLLVIDSWADLNFELHEHRADGFKLWVHPKFVRDHAAFRREHTPLGRRILRESVDDAVRFIRLVRRTNPNLPVLFLHQQVDHYPKLPDERTERFRALGEKVAERLDGVWFGGVVPTDLLEPDDVGSAGGPGNTLHYLAATYRRMWNQAVADGLGTAVEQRRAAAEAGEAGSVVLARPRRGDGDIEIGEAVTATSVLGPECTIKCRASMKRAPDALGRYATIDGLGVGDEQTRFTPMMIDLAAPTDFASWEQSIKKFGKGARLRAKRKATGAGYVTHEFHRGLHIPDIHEINNSMESRSGGLIRDNLKRSVEELGGAPVEHLLPEAPSCPVHWGRHYGVFQPLPGHRQGDVVTDEKLVGLIVVARRGDLVTYVDFIGHGDHLGNGVMTLLHHDLVEQMMAGTDPTLSGIRFVMYGGAENGTPDLQRFKRQAGFTAHPLDLRTGAA